MGRLTAIDTAYTQTSETSRTEYTYGVDEPRLSKDEFNATGIKYEGAAVREFSENAFREKLGLNKRVQYEPTYVPEYGPAER